MVTSEAIEVSIFLVSMQPSLSLKCGKAQMSQRNHDGIVSKLRKCCRFEMSKQLYKCFSIVQSDTLLSWFCFVAMLINFPEMIFCTAKYRCVMYRVCSHVRDYKCCCQRIKDAIQAAIFLKSFIMRSNSKHYI